MLTGNKGEWSEIYAFLKLLADKKLYAGDANLQINTEQFYPIIKIIRYESDIRYQYTIDDDLVTITGGIEEKVIRSKVFERFAIILFEHILASDGSFAVPIIENFLNSIYCKTLKAKSNSKSDIFIVIHDKRTNSTHELGFSIKSQLGAESTLLNASQPTNFTFKINNFSPDEKLVDSINRIDTKSKVKDKIIAIKDIGGNLEFFALENNIFKNNLVLIDTALPDIFAEIVLVFYTSKLNNISELTAKIDEKNPLRYDKSSPHQFYQYKIKRFLTDVALGMVPKTVWTGTYDATGGYLVVKGTGEVVCYHIYNKNQFDDYLFLNTKLETASTERHNFGNIYKENDEYFFKLNLQIRFK